MPHHFHAARDSGVNGIQGETRQRTEHERKPGRQLAIQSKSIAEKPNGDQRHDGDDDALQERQENRQAKQGVAASMVAHGFGARDKGDDRVIEAEQADLAQQLNRRPCHQISPERSRSEKPRDKKSKDAAKVRRQQSDGVDQRAALQLSALIDRRDDRRERGARLLPQYS